MFEWFNRQLKTSFHEHEYSAWSKTFVLVLQVIHKTVHNDTEENPAKLTFSLAIRLLDEFIDSFSPSYLLDYVDFASKIERLVSNLKLIPNKPQTKNSQMHP